MGLFLNSYPLAISLFLCQDHAIFVPMAVWYTLKLDIVIFPTRLFLFRVAIAI